MIIEVGSKSRTKKLANVSPGECFRFQGGDDIFLRCRTSLRVSVDPSLVCAVSLGDNIVMAFMDNENGKDVEIIEDVKVVVS